MRFKTQIKLHIHEVFHWRKIIGVGGVFFLTFNGDAAGREQGTEENRASNKGYSHQL